MSKLDRLLKSFQQHTPIDIQQKVLLHANLTEGDFEELKEERRVTSGELVPWVSVDDGDRVIVEVFSDEESATEYYNDRCDEYREAIDEGSVVIDQGKTHLDGVL